MASSIVAPADGSQLANQPSLRAKHEHWRQECMRNQNDVAHGFNEVIRINDGRDALLEEMLTKIDELEQKQQTEKSGQVWKHSQELGRAKKANESLLDENDALKEEINGVKEKYSALQDQLEKLRDSKQVIIEEKNGLHERIMDLESDIRQHKDTIRATQRKFAPPPSKSKGFRLETSRSVVASRGFQVNDNILKKDFRAYDSEMRALVDIPVDIDPEDTFLKQLLQGPELCKWFYLHGICKNSNCASDHTHPKLTSGQMDRLLFLGRQEMCNRKEACTQRTCFFGHPKITASRPLILQQSMLKRVKEEDTSTDDDGRKVRPRN